MDEHRLHYEHAVEQALAVHHPQSAHNSIHGLLVHCRVLFGGEVQKVEERAEEEGSGGGQVVSEVVDDDAFFVPVALEDVLPEIANIHALFLRAQVLEVDGGACDFGDVVLLLGLPVAAPLPHALPVVSLYLPHRLNLEKDLAREVQALNRRPETARTQLQDSH